MPPPTRPLSAIDKAKPGPQTTPMREVPMISDPQSTWPLARTLAWVVLAVMTVALVYTGWIAITNFNRIGV